MAGNYVWQGLMLGLRLALLDQSGVYVSVLQRHILPHSYVPQDTAVRTDVVLGWGKIRAVWMYDGQTRMYR